MTSHAPGKLLSACAVWFALLGMWLAYSIWVRQRSEFWQAATMSDAGTRYLVFGAAVGSMLAVAIYGAIRSTSWAYEMALSLNAGLGVLLFAIALHRYVVAGQPFSESFASGNGLIALVSFWLCALILRARRSRWTSGHTE